MGTVIDYESFGEVNTDNGYKTFFARKKGRSHIANGTLCQDYCLVKNIGTDIQIVAIADGHGGEAYVKSDIGSRIACELLYDFAYDTHKHSGTLKQKNLWLDIFLTNNFKRSFIQTWKSKVLQDYKENEDIINETESSIVKKYGTTLIFGIFTNEKIVIGQLGDGAVLLFDKNDKFQLFKRHDVKVTSATSSLVSGRAEYAFVTECYDRNCFPYILLSTDGIYDKLDTSDAFHVYGKYLVNQQETLGTVEAPFNIDEKLDVSEITKDDCSIVLVKNEAYEVDETVYKVLLTQYDCLRFYRRISGLEIYYAEKDGEQFTIHIVDNLPSFQYRDNVKLNIMRPIKKKRIGSKIVFVYPFEDARISVKELIETGEHLEKRYDFNKSEIIEDDNLKEENFYGNVFWMRFYEYLYQLRDSLQNCNITLKKFAFESSFFSSNGILTFYEDALENVPMTRCEKQFVIDLLEQYFSIIGKIKCGKVEVPLYKCNAQGQNIDMLHYKAMKKSLGRVIYNPDKQIYGLWNTSGSDWILVNEKKKSVSAQGVLRLNRNHSILIKIEDSDDITDIIETKDGFVQYEVLTYLK
jgi:serine/threonine protein phosphatase PrpC